jgi:hypothetical protein
MKQCARESAAAKLLGRCVCFKRSLCQSSVEQGTSHSVPPIRKWHNGSMPRAYITVGPLCMSSHDQPDWLAWGGCDTSRGDEDKRHFYCRLCYQGKQRRIAIQAQHSVVFRQPGRQKGGERGPRQELLYRQLHVPDFDADRCLLLC